VKPVPPAAPTARTVPVKLRPSHIEAIDAARGELSRFEWMRLVVAGAVRMGHANPLRLRRLLDLVADPAPRWARPARRALTVNVHMGSVEAVLAVTATAAACGLKRSTWCRAVLRLAAADEKLARDFIGGLQER